jgi:hypothetical protein
MYPLWCVGLCGQGVLPQQSTAGSMATNSMVNEYYYELPILTDRQSSKGAAACEDPADLANH